MLSTGVYVRRVQEVVDSQVGHNFEVLNDYDNDMRAEAAQAQALILRLIFKYIRSSSLRREKMSSDWHLGPVNCVVHLIKHKTPKTQP